MDQKPEGATTVFVLGLIGLLCCQILGIVAWILGNNYLKRCRQMNVQPEGLAVAGRILGIMATVLWILWIIGLVIFLAVAGVAGVAGISQQS